MQKYFCCDILHFIAEVNYTMKLNYRIKFELLALILFALIMLPNIIWACIKTDNDILRQISVTPVIDMIGSVCQVVFVALLCLVSRTDRAKIRVNTYIILTCLFTLLYYLSWVFYLCGSRSKIILLSLTLFPWLAFILYALDRKNYIALVPLSVFSVCHIIYCLYNFIM